MDFSSVRLVASDMDGTLLNTQHQLSPDFFPIFHYLQSKGILFCAASGRQYQNLYNCFPGIQNEIIFIAENGSYVMYQNKELHVQQMDRAVTHDILSRTKEIQNLMTILCGKKSAYIDNRNPAFIERLSKYYDKYTIVDNLLHVDDDEFLKIAICDLAGAEQHSYPHFRDYQDQLQVKVSGDVWLDLSHKLAHKGNALDVVKKKFGIDHQHTMVFGDYLNDVEMMLEAHYSFAMETAHPEVKRVAKFTTQGNDDRGVLNVLEKL